MVSETPTEIDQLGKTFLPSTAETWECAFYTNCDQLYKLLRKVFRTTLFKKVSQVPLNDELFYLCISIPFTSFQLKVEQLSI